LVALQTVVAFATISAPRVPSLGVIGPDHNRVLLRSLANILGLEAVYPASS
jgi:hypothetical protein